MLALHPSNGLSLSLLPLPLPYLFSPLVPWLRWAQCFPPPRPGGPCCLVSEMCTPLAVLNHMPCDSNPLPPPPSVINGLNPQISTECLLPTMHWGHSSEMSRAGPSQPPAAVFSGASKLAVSQPLLSLHLHLSNSSCLLPLPPAVMNSFSEFLLLLL